MMIQELSEGWQFRGEGQYRYWMPAQVPGCVHTDLLRQGLIPHPFSGRNELKVQWIEEQAWEYQLLFAPVPELLKMEHIELVFHGLDTVATVWLNGERILASDNMFLEHRIDVKGVIQQGENRLLVRFSSPLETIRSRKTSRTPQEWNDPVGGCSTLRKMQSSFGWDWGPRLVTAGLWLPVVLQGWRDNLLTGCKIRQEHRDGRVFLYLSPEARRPEAVDNWRVEVRDPAGSIVAEGGLSLTIPHPRLWQPNGLGEPYLYTVSLSSVAHHPPLRWQRRIGLRTIELRCEPDEWGQSFGFVVNGRPIFARGANWIPAHALVSENLCPAYRDLLESARICHLNMIRVWGGGIYEKDEFYDLCDEKGLLVWQDFMFACACYPADPGFLASVEEEARQQIRRLRHHACLALWCGNNEIEVFPPVKDPANRRDYDLLFQQLLPSVVEREDGQTAYWPGSPHTPESYPGQGEPGRSAGDVHEWAVWHGLQPAGYYEKTYHRFCSEFGMQSYPHPQVIQPYLTPGQLDIFSPEFENHQKHPGGNGKIFHYLARYFRFPRDYRCLSYLSQVNQALCVKTGVEHWRRHLPRCQGALYWQLNDCWPVASWSSIDFGGVWKALQYEARRFFAPLAISAEVNGEVTCGIGNYYRNTIRGVRLHAVNESGRDVLAEVCWTLFLTTGEKLDEERLPVLLVDNRAVCLRELDFSPQILTHGPEKLALRLTLETSEGVVAENYAFFHLPRFLELSARPPKVSVQAGQRGIVRIRLDSPVPLFFVLVELDGRPSVERFSDNYFHLWPDRPVEITLSLPEGWDCEVVRQRLRVLTLAQAGMTN